MATFNTRERQILTKLLHEVINQSEYIPENVNDQHGKMVTKDGFKLILDKQSYRDVIKAKFKIEMDASAEDL